MHMENVVKSGNLKDVFAKTSTESSFMYPSSWNDNPYDSEKEIVFEAFTKVFITRPITYSFHFLRHVTIDTKDYSKCINEFHFLQWLQHLAITQNWFEYSKRLHYNHWIAFNSPRLSAILDWLLIWASERKAVNH